MTGPQASSSRLLDRGIRVALITSVLFVVVAFLGGEPASARGFYYLLWLSFTGWVWARRDTVGPWLRSRPLPEFPLFVGLGLLMIILEETLAGILVHLLSAPSAAELLGAVPQYYFNNLFLLPGFIIAWYLLLKLCDYSRTEVFVLVGLFGLFAEKIHLHVLAFPILGIALILPTMFTYMGIILPSLLSLRSHGTRRWHWSIRYSVGFLFPILVSIPFLMVHGWLTEAGFIDPGILTR